MVSYHFDETVRRSSLSKASTSRRVPGCENQGNSTPGDVERRAPNKVRLFQVDKSYKICAVTLLIMALAVTPVLGALGPGEADAELHKLLQNETKPYPSGAKLLGYLEGKKPAGKIKFIDARGNDDAVTTRNKELRRAALITHIMLVVEQKGWTIAAMEGNWTREQDSSFIAYVAANYLKFINLKEFIANFDKRRARATSTRPLQRTHRGVASQQNATAAAAAVSPEDDEGSWDEAEAAFAYSYTQALQQLRQLSSASLDQLSRHDLLDGVFEDADPSDLPQEYIGGEKCGPHEEAAGPSSDSSPKTKESKRMGAVAPPKFTKKVTRTKESERMDAAAPQSKRMGATAPSKRSARDDIIRVFKLRSSENQLV